MIELTNDIIPQHFIFCNCNYCPMHCLRRKAYFVAKPEREHMDVYLFEKVQGGEKCEHFLPSEPIELYRGFDDEMLTEQISAKDWKVIKKALINRFRRTRYYDYRNGKKRMAQADAQYMKKLLAKYGYSDLQPFKEVTETFQWSNI